MAITAASYRKPQAHLTPNEFAQQSALTSDLVALCAEGMIEAFRDEEGVIRYRPIQRAA